MILETERLCLREMTQEDFPALCKVLQDEAVMYAYEHAFAGEEAQGWITNCVDTARTDLDCGPWCSKARAK